MVFYALRYQLPGIMFDFGNAARHMGRAGSSSRPASRALSGKAGLFVNPVPADQPLSVPGRECECREQNFRHRRRGVQQGELSGV